MNPVKTKIYMHSSWSFGLFVLNIVFVCGRLVELGCDLYCASDYAIDVNMVIEILVEGV